MKHRYCHTQAEMEAALAAKEIPLLVGSGWFEVRDSSTVRAYGSSTVTAYDSSTVTAYDSSTVTACGSSTVRAYDSATVRASKYNAVTQHGAGPKITGGVVIKVPDLSVRKNWLDYHGVEELSKGVVVLYKAVTDDFKLGYGWDYSPGETPKAEKWSADGYCGNGLHFCGNPSAALNYMSETKRFVACPVRKSEINVIDETKVKAPRVVAPGCWEVDINGNRIEAK